MLQTTINDYKIKNKYFNFGTVQNLLERLNLSFRLMEKKLVWNVCTYIIKSIDQRQKKQKKNIYFTQEIISFFVNSLKPIMNINNTNQTL